MTYDDEIALLAEDIRRYSNHDARIDEALTQMLKLVQAEVDALAFEGRELVKDLVRETTLREAARIRTEEHNRTVRWVNHNDSALGW